MTSLLRHAALLAVAAALSWWLLLYSPSRSAPARRTPPSSPPVSITPRLEHPPRMPEQSASQEPAPPRTRAADPPPARKHEGQDPPAPPPPELGTPDGVADPAAPASEEAPDPAPAPKKAARKPKPDSPEQKTEPASAPAVHKLMQDASLLRKARAELTGKVRKGFATVLLAAPEDQVRIARFFGEELVLVPRSALDPKRSNPVWFRLRTGRSPVIEEVRSRPPLDRYRQYRDLFDYEYGRLPAPLRTLRKSVLLRSEVYLFAALIPPSEWAAVIGRRSEALAESGKDLSQVRRFVMRYVGAPNGGFDILVQEIVLANGVRVRPKKSRGT